MAKRPTSVRMSSVPRCLRHAYDAAPLEDAGYLTAFLHLVCESMASNSDGLPDDDVAMGLSLTFDLLRDKIDIALGTLPFPRCDAAADELTLPPLWKEQGGGGDDE